MSNSQENGLSRHLLRRISRRQAIKAGGIAALGLIFTTPQINTIRPSSAFAQYGGPQPTPTPTPTATPVPPTQPCTAFIDTQNSSISGPGIGGSAVQSGAASDYFVSLTYDCGICSNGPCTPSFAYQWSTSSTPELTFVITNGNAASPTVTAALDLGGSGFGFAQYELQVIVTLTCGVGACISTTQAVITSTVDVFS